MNAATQVLVLLLAAPPEPPTPATVARTVERSGASVVRIVSGGSGEAVVVGVNGEILTASRAAKTDDLVVQVGKDRRKAHVVARDTDTGTVMARLDDAGDLHPPAVGKVSRLPAGANVVVLAHDHGEVSPTIARLEGVRDHPGQFRIVPSARAGSAVFNTHGDLVAIQTERGGKGALTAAIEDVRARFGPGTPASP